MWVCHSKVKWNLPHSFSHPEKCMGRWHGECYGWFSEFSLEVHLKSEERRRSCMIVCGIGVVISPKDLDVHWEWLAFMFVILAALMLVTHQRHDSVCSLLLWQHNGDPRYSESFFSGVIKHYMLSRFISLFRINRKMIQTSLFCMPSAGCLCVCV